MPKYTQVQDWQNVFDNNNESIPEIADYVAFKKFFQLPTSQQRILDGLTGKTVKECLEGIEKINLLPKDLQQQFIAFVTSKVDKNAKPEEQAQQLMNAASEFSLTTGANWVKDQYAQSEHGKNLRDMINEDKWNNLQNLSGEELKLFIDKLKGLILNKKDLQAFEKFIDRDILSKTLPEQAKELGKIFEAFKQVAKAQVGQVQPSQLSQPKAIAAAQKVDAVPAEALKPTTPKVATAPVTSGTQPSTAAKSFERNEDGANASVKVTPKPAETKVVEIKRISEEVEKINQLAQEIKEAVERKDQNIDRIINKISSLPFPLSQPSSTAALIMLNDNVRLAITENAIDPRSIPFEEIDKRHASMLKRLYELGNYFIDKAENAKTNPDNPNWQQTLVGSFESAETATLAIEALESSHSNLSSIIAYNHIEIVLKEKMARLEAPQDRFANLVEAVKLFPADNTLSQMIISLQQIQSSQVKAYNEILPLRYKSPKDIKLKLNGLLRNFDTYDTRFSQELASLEKIVEKRKVQLAAVDNKGRVAPEEGANKPAKPTQQGGALKLSSVQSRVQPKQQAQAQKAPHKKAVSSTYPSKVAMPKGYTSEDFARKQQILSSEFKKLNDQSLGSRDRAMTPQRIEQNKNQQQLPRLVETPSGQTQPPQIGTNKRINLPPDQFIQKIREMNRQPDALHPALQNKIVDADWNAKGKIDVTYKNDAANQNRRFAEYDPHNEEFAAEVPNDPSEKQLCFRLTLIAAMKVYGRDKINVDHASDEDRAILKALASDLKIQIKFNQPKTKFAP